MHWQTSRFKLELTRPWVMGIVNLTPDSFSDGGQHAQGSQALQHAERLLREGAGILDVGAESTRPGAQAVPLEDELARLMPFLREAVSWQVPISVDTYKPEVMEAVLDLGVDIINDIWALRQPGAERVVVAHPSCGVCLMHMHRDPQTMQLHTMSGDVVSDVKLFLQARMESLLAQGVDAARLVLDPGIGFGKTVTQNFELLAHQAELMLEGRPILSAWSRKSSLGAVLSQDGVIPQPSERLSASVAAALLAVERGARLIRVHDVKATVDALKVWQALQTAAAEK
ncbi:dihydropteroate synthase [Limnohabitans sp.]|jgi:dihydropteroate synthase|uniref:dihydropteroate synthase n=1 Tax=Limnohabitans sp. TaxID=1907725 RepID=UPI0037BF912A